MPGRRLCSEQEAALRGFDDPLCSIRRQVLRDTLAALGQSQVVTRLRERAFDNLARWERQAEVAPAPFRVQVFPGDWGVIAGALTKRYGKCFAVLNMANAFVPGGAYVEGAAAQEENMYRRSDCHFHIGPAEIDEEYDAYWPEMTWLLSAEDGTVYLDSQTPRICVRGPEDRAQASLGYAWLPEDQVFPYFELRAAAQDLRDGSEFDPDDARRRIAAQLDTLVAHGLRHAVLGAFGCGAFLNPATQVAQIYRDEIHARAAEFDVIAFAILAPGYGPDNYAPFAQAF